MFIQNIIYLSQMARNYPRFIFDHVTSGKSPGRFIAHLLQPLVLLSVWEEGRSVKIRLVENYNDAPEAKVKPVMQDALDWYLRTHHNTNPETDQGTANLIVGLSLENAYEEKINVRAVGNTLDLARSTASNIRRDLAQGKFPSINTMRAQLEKAGWKCLQEEKWLKMKETFN